jgi:hypothetical protein
MNRAPGQPAGHAYPIPRSDHSDDPRFTLGLALDVADVLTRHGYPPITTGADLRHLQQALFTTIYQTRENP